MSTRHPDDFLGWAPAEPLEWAPEQPVETSPQARTGPAPESARPAGDGVALTPLPVWQPPMRPARQPPRSEPARTPRPPQPSPALTSASLSPRPLATPVRRRQPAGPLFGVTAIAAGLLMLSTIAMVLKELTGERTLGLLPILVGAATLALVRAAARMRSR